VEIVSHLSIRIGCCTQAPGRIVLGRAAAEVAAGVAEDNDPWFQRLRSGAAEAGPSTCAEGNTYLDEEVGCGSLWNKLALGCRNKSLPMGESCCMKCVTRPLGDLNVLGELGLGFWVRWRSWRWCRRNARSCRSESTTLANQENQPGATRCRRNTPVAAAAKVVRATCHSHTAVAVLRDDCSKVRLRPPGFALARSTGDPAYRLRCSSPRRTVKVVDKGPQTRRWSGRVELFV